MTLPLDRLPAELPGALRRAKLASPLATSLPGGPQRYLEILAAQVESQRRILVATSQPPTDGADAAARITEALAAVAQWWDQHGYVGGSSGGRVAWNVVPDRQRELVAAWAKTLDAGQVAAIRAAVPDATKHLLDGILPR
jgi:dienelactone hydrolase